MYAQFFGNFLLSHELITTEQLLAAMERKNANRPRLGTLAMHAGYLSASEVEHIHIVQTHKDRKFGELAVELGLLTQAQVDELLALQVPDYLAFGQALIDMGIIDTYEWERLVADYISENEINELDFAEDSRERIEYALGRYVTNRTDSEPIAGYKTTYTTLLFNNLIRFIGDDFTPVTSINFEEYPTEFCISQEIHGKYHIKLYIDMPKETCIAFASRYVGDDFTEFDEYVEASIMDFANLHNGLFCVNESNSDDVELTLDPPQIEEGPLLVFEHPTTIMPVIYPFGTINFIFEMKA
ncbi:MAG: chemotaxis protein CheX [Roseburia sp.]|nr:chemotaxis protein CheX [Roseburia sp.]